MDILIKLANFVSIVSGLTTDKVIIARSNYLQSDFTEDIALIDILTSQAVGRTSEYIGDTEKLTYRVHYKSSVTIDFFGINSYVNINKFVARLASQDASEFKRDNLLEVFFSKNILNLKNIQGKTIYNRYQLEIMVKYYTDFTDDVLRLDTVDLTVNTNSEKQITVNI